MFLGSPCWRGGLHGRDGVCPHLFQPCGQEGLNELALEDEE